MKTGATQTPPSEPARWLEQLDATFARLHTAKEDSFWTARMGLTRDAAAAQAELDARDIEMQRFLQDPRHLEHTRSMLPSAAAGDEQTALRGWLATFESHVIDSAAGRALAE